MNASINVAPDSEDHPEGPGWTVRLHVGNGRPDLVRRMRGDRDSEGGLWPVPDPAYRPAEGDAGSWDVEPAEFRELARRVREEASGTDGVRYGRYLFDALLGPEPWDGFDSKRAPVVVPLTLPKGVLQGLVWELLHDGDDYLALRAARPVVLPRLVGSGVAPSPDRVHPPAVLFAVGGRLEDRRMSAGAEVMALFRDIGRSSGDSVPLRVLTESSLPRLKSACAEMRPDVVHLIGHGTWDAAGGGRLALRADNGTSEERYGAAELADAVGSPTMLVLSACDGAVSTTDASAPLAAELAASGIPVVVAMAGAIGDTACRVFARALVAAVTRGIAFFEAVAMGRSAARMAGAGGDGGVDWALPTVFTGYALEPDFALDAVDARAAVRDAVKRHGLGSVPLFAGRQDVVEEFDALLGPGGPTSLTLVSEHDGSVGGTRVLRELATAAIQHGHVPVLCGEAGAGDGPTSQAALARHVLTAMKKVARREGVVLAEPGRTLQLFGWSTLGQLNDDTGPVDQDDLADALRADLLHLRDLVHGARPDVFGPARSPVLLLDDVHHFGVDGRDQAGRPAVSGLERLLQLVGANGLGDGTPDIPVVMYGHLNRTAGNELHRERERYESLVHRSFLQLRHLRDLKDGHLAFLSWALNPTARRGEPVKAAAPAARWRREPREPWIDGYEMVTREDGPFYDARAHARFVAKGVELTWLVANDDNALLRTIGMLG